MITKKAHYFPCKWLALWNSNYYENFLAENLKNLSARNQLVFCYIKSHNRILQLKTESIFFEKGLGFIEYETDEGKFRQSLENIFSKLENILTGDWFKFLIISKKIDSLEVKQKIALIIVFQVYRNPIVFRDIINSYVEKGVSPEFLLKNYRRDVLISREFWMNSTVAIVSKRWFLLSSCFSFPISDFNLLHSDDCSYYILTPYLAVKITNETVLPEESARTSTYEVSQIEYDEIVNRVRNYTTNFIVANNEDLLVKISK